MAAQKVEEQGTQLQNSRETGPNFQTVQFPSKEIMPGVSQSGNKISITERRLENPLVGSVGGVVCLLYPNNQAVPNYVSFTIGPNWTTKESEQIKKATSIIERYLERDPAIVQELNKPGTIVPRLYEIAIGTPREGARLKGGLFVTSPVRAIDHKIFLPRHVVKDLMTLTFNLTEEGFHAQDKQIDIDNANKSLTSDERKRRAELRAIEKREELYNRIVSEQFPSEWKAGLEDMRKDIDELKKVYGSSLKNK